MACIPMPPQTFQSSKSDDALYSDALWPPSAEAIHSNHSICKPVYYLPDNLIYHGFVLVELGMFERLFAIFMLRSVIILFIAAT